MTDLLIHNATIVTMDAERRVLEASSVAIANGRIAEIGPAATLADRHPQAKRLDASKKILLPGLVDLHGYLGGSLLKSIGEDMDAATKRDKLETVLSRSTDEEWWAVEAELAAVERLKLGTTTMFSMMGGNGTRTDAPVFAEIAAEALGRIGLRTRIGLSPARPPWPRPYSTWRNGQESERQVGFEEVIQVCDGLLAKQARGPRGLVDYCVALSRIGNRNDHDPVWTPERGIALESRNIPLAHFRCASSSPLARFSNSSRSSNGGSITTRPRRSGGGKYALSACQPSISMALARLSRRKCEASAAAAFGSSSHAVRRSCCRISDSATCGEPG